jgi:voltage-gated potassium channel
MIRRVFQDPSYPGFRIWHQLIAVLIFVSCATLSLETVPEIAQSFSQEFFLAEWISVAFFTIDYIGNIAYDRRGVRYIFSVWGLIDLLSIAPSYLMLLNLTAVQGTKVLRLLRVARVLRVLKLARMAAPAHPKKGTSQIGANLRIYFIVLFSVLMISSTAMYFVEGHLYSDEAISAGQSELDARSPGATERFVPSDPISGAPIPEDKRFFTSIPAAMWWCIVTLTTTGYGDMYPVTVGGRFVAAATMLFGLVLFGILLNVVGKTLMIVLFAQEDE